MKIEEAEGPPPPSEAALVAAAQRDPAAFGPLYERYVDQIYRYVYRRVGNHADAEDLTAQTFQQALAALPQYEWRGVPFGAWLYRIAGNAIIQRGRTGSREITVDDITSYSDRQPSDADDPADLLSRAAAGDELVAAIRRLPAEQQRVLVLKFSHGLKTREIADVIGRSEGAVKQLVHRAMLSLRATLQDQGAGGA
jgi:RNA polymerase sigma-70 factor (ECF subfamily)